MIESKNYNDYLFLSEIPMSLGIFRVLRTRISRKSLRNECQKKNAKKSFVAARVIVRAKYVAVKKQVGSVTGPTVSAQPINARTNHPRTTKRTTSLRLRLSR